MIVGITGTSGSGKSTVAKVFEEFGFHHIDLDDVSRDVTTAGSACLKEIVSVFGECLLNADGSLNRRALGEIVFRDENALTALNEITHKYILLEMNRIIDATDGDILLDVPLLFESKINEICDFTIGVIAEREDVIERICARDGISPETAAARLDKQQSNKFFIKNCDYCIENTQDRNELYEKAQKLIKTLKERTADE